MVGGIELLRLETVHAAVVHFTIGSLPLIFLSHAIGRWRGSDRFTFAGDVALAFGAVSAVASVATGIVAYTVLSWPHGLDYWAWLHITLGATTAATLVAFAVRRLVVRTRVPVARTATALAGALVTAAGIATGWVGGEVLVFHAGMAVKGAARGSLAPPILASRQPPASIEEAMGRLRSHWAAVDVASAEMMVTEPSPELFRTIHASARDIERLAEWVATHGADQYAAAGGSPRQLASMAELLGKRAREVAGAAAEENPIQLSRSLGDLEAACTGCHATLRWVENGQGPELRHQEHRGGDVPQEQTADEAPEEFGAPDGSAEEAAEADPQVR